MPQVPTARGVKIRSAADAHLLFYAVHLGRLPMIQRRLDASERAEVVSGAVFVWEERSAASTTVPGNPSTDDGANAVDSGSPSGIVSGIERWTDGLKWGPSRVRDDFLFYQEKDPNEKESLISPPPVLAQSTYGPYRSQSGKHGAKLIKQTYSVHYYPQVLDGKPPTEPARKWHLTAYHSVQTIDRLADVMAIRELQDLSAPPEGLFKKARVGKKPVGPTPATQVNSPTTSRTPMVRTSSDSWHDASSSASQGPFTPSTEVTYAAPQSRHSHHPGSQPTIRYATPGYPHPPQQHPHARSMSVGYPVETPPHYAHPHPQHHGRSSSTSEHGQYHAPYHAYEYSPRPSAQFPGYYPPPTEPHPGPYYGYPHSRSQSYSGPPPPAYPYHAPHYHHPPQDYPPYDRDPSLTQPGSPSEMQMARRISFPPPPPAPTYDHPFAYQPPPLAPTQGETPARQLPTPPAQSPEHRYAIPIPPPSASGQYYHPPYDSTPSAAPNPQAYGSPHPTHLVRSPPSGVVRTTRKTRRPDDVDGRGSDDARGAHFSPYGRPVNHPGPRHHSAVDSSTSVASEGHFDPFHAPIVQQGPHSRPSSMAVAATYPSRPTTESRSQQHSTDYPYDSTPGQWSNGPAPVALQSQSAYPMPADASTQFRHATTAEAQTSSAPVVSGHFQPQLQPLVNPDGSPPFTHFRSSSGTDIANVTGASQGSTSSTSGIPSTQVPAPAPMPIPIPAPPPPPAAPRLDMHLTGGSVTSQTSATSATGAAASSKLGPLTPSTYHQRDPEDERVLELLSRVAPGTTTPVTTASGQPVAVNGDGDGVNDVVGLGE